MTTGPLAEPSSTLSTTATQEVLAFCRIGERSSRTWFVLTQFLGYEHVKNDDGSWIEWGSLVGVPVEKGAGS